MRRIMLAALATLLATAQAVAAADCKKLLKESYWRKVRVEQVVRCLQEGLDPNTKIKITKRLYYPLLKVAIRNSSPEVVKALIAGGADIEYRDGIEGPEFVKEVIAAGVDIDQRTIHRFIFGESLLDYAIKIGRVSKIEILLDAGVGFDDKDPIPYSLPVETVKLLLDTGWNPNRRWPWDGETALHNAARFGEPEVVLLLLEYGADPTIPDHKGRTPFSRSKGENRRILADALGINLTKPKTKSGFGALAAGVLGAVVASEAGLNDDEALSVGQDAADTVRTGTPTTRSTTAAMDRTRAAEEAAALREQIQRDMEQAVIDALAADADAAHDTQQEVEEEQRQQEVEEKLRQQRTAREQERQRREEEDRRRQQARIEARNAKMLSGNCRCIRIQDNGEYSCLDGFVYDNDSSSNKPRCDIYRGK